MPTFRPGGSSAVVRERIADYTLVEAGAGRRALLLSALDDPIDRASGRYLPERSVAARVSRRWDDPFRPTRQPTVICPHDRAIGRELAAGHI